MTDIKVIGITWGELDETIVQLDPVDFILGSDCFYDSKGTSLILMGYLVQSVAYKGNCVISRLSK